MRSPLTSSHMPRFCTSLDLVGRHQPGTERTEGRRALALHPVAAALELKLALGHVVGEAVAGDVVHRVVFRRYTRRCLPMTMPSSTSQSVFCESLRNDDVVVRTDDAVRRLVEQDRLGRDWHVRFGGVIGVVEADRDEIAGLADAGADARAAGHGVEIVVLERFGYLFQMLVGKVLARRSPARCPSSPAACPWRRSRRAFPCRPCRNEPVSSSDAPLGTHICADMLVR